MALAASAHGQHEDALHCVEAMQALRPWDPSTACTAGQVQEAAGQLQQAFASYTTAIALGPSHVPSLLRMGEWEGREFVCAFVYIVMTLCCAPVL